MNDLNRSDIENICREIFGAFQGMLSWRWDSRFEAVLAEFGGDVKDRVRETLERYLSFTWHSANIEQSPDAVRMINSHLGGLRIGQLFFTSDPNQDVFVFGSWWPWGDGKTISIRVALSYDKLSESERVEFINLLKHWFGI
ncbi:MAG: hypothetical protein ABID54_01490 [Pseudomonadota bacterium]